MRFQSVIPALLISALVLSGVAQAAQRFGEELSLEDLTPIEEVLSRAAELEGQRVRVAGEVSGVCQRKGCWMDVRSDSGASLRIKVKDGVIVFPAESLGHGAVVEGVVELLDMEREAYVAWQQHFAEDAGESFDPTSIGEGPFRIVRLQGRGAEIAEASPEH